MDLPRLQYVLRLFRPVENNTDSVQWLLSKDGIFSLPTCYVSLCLRYVNLGPPNCYNYAIKDIWKVDVPLKVRDFGWRCILNKSPTKDFLNLRGIIPSSSNLDCVFCEELAESLSYSLLACRKVEVIWKDMVDWLGLNFTMSHDFKERFCRWSSSCCRLNIKRSKVGNIWLAIV